MEKNPAAALMRVIKGMLPHNTLGARTLKKLRVYAGPEHPHQAQVVARKVS
jgi:large subunit ribosomal protein L13